MKFFTDQEYRILLAALSRERKVCEYVDDQYSGEIELVGIMNNIEKKLFDIQYKIGENNDVRQKEHEMNETSE